MKKEAKQIKVTVITEGVRRLVFVASWTLAVVVLLCSLVWLPESGDGPVEVLIPAAIYTGLAFFAPRVVAKIAFWIINGFHES